MNPACSASEVISKTKQNQQDKCLQCPGLGTFILQGLVEVREAGMGTGRLKE